MEQRPLAEAGSAQGWDAQAYARWFAVFSLGSVCAASGFLWTVTRPDSHPLVFASALSWIITVVVAAATRTMFVRMDPRRFRFARWENEGRVYRMAGVEAFCWLLQHTPLGWLNPRLKLTCRRSGIEPLLREMNFAEGAHWVGGVITLGVAGGYTAAGHRAVGLCCVLLTVLFHLYPVMAQRWNRGRALRIYARWKTMGI